MEIILQLILKNQNRSASLFHLVALKMFINTFIRDFWERIRPILGNTKDSLTGK